jgi:peptidoglycan/xylan/chitin deacetylase (PgdA/CDA1 family)
VLTDTGFPGYSGKRSPIVESAFEYGPRAGVWRILRILKKFDVKCSVLGVVKSLERNPDALAAFIADGHEIVSHGYRWLDYQSVDEPTER